MYIPTNGRPLSKYFPLWNDTFSTGRHSPTNANAGFEILIKNIMAWYPPVNNHLAIARKSPCFALEIHPSFTVHFLLPAMLVDPPSCKTWKTKSDMRGTAHHSIWLLFFASVASNFPWSPFKRNTLPSHNSVMVPWKTGWWFQPLWKI